jgi:FtsP/CotA-like multicopper oxidase with cupredoxin domain
MSSEFLRGTVQSETFLRVSRLRLGELQHAAGLRNGSDDIHPMHLHRHSFELTKFAGKATSGVMKDVVMVGGYQEVEVDFVADNSG